MVALKNLLTTPWFISVVIGLLIILWVKMCLNSFAAEIMQKDEAQAQQPIQTLEPQQPAQQAPQPTQTQPVQPEPSAKQTDIQPPTQQDINPLFQQPPPTQPRPEIPWGNAGIPPMPIGTTFIQVEADPMEAEDAAFDHAE